MSNNEKAAEPSEYKWISYAEQKPQKPGLYLISNGSLIRAAIFLPATECWSSQHNGLIAASWGLKFWCPMPPMQDEPPVEEQFRLSEELNSIAREANDLNQQLDHHVNADRELRNELSALIVRLSEVAKKQARLYQQDQEKENNRD